MSVLRGLRAGLMQTLTVAALLLIPAGLAPHGTWVWARGIAFVAAYGAISLAGAVALAVWRPRSFEVRQQSVVADKARKQPWLDAVGSVGLLAFGAAWVVFMPLDAFWWRLLPPPPFAIAVIGLVAAMAGVALWSIAAWENRFATPNVQDQSNDGQQVIDTGVYGLVRHPIYLGNLLLVGGAPLWLGSTAGLWGLAVMLVMTVGRIVIEEAHLRANLPGYDAYASRVRARLIPFVV